MIVAASAAVPGVTRGRLDSESCRTWPPLSESLQSSPSRSSSHVGTAAGADEGARAARHGLPWCTGTSGRSVRYVDVLSHPEGEAAKQRPRLFSSEEAPKLSAMALVEQLRTQPANCAYAEAILLHLPAPIQEAATPQERPEIRDVPERISGRS